MTLFYKKYEYFFKKHNIKFSDYQIIYFDKVLGGSANINIIEGIIFDFNNSDFYSIRWAKDSDKLLLLYMIFIETQENDDWGVGFFEFDGVFYDEFSDSFLDNFGVSDCLEIQIYCDFEDLYYASRFVRGIYTDDFSSNIFGEAGRDLRFEW